MPPTRQRVAVIGCGEGGLTIALALANPHHVIAGFDADPVAIATARRAAARHRVSDRVTFEAAPPDRLLGRGYDIVIMLDQQRIRAEAQPGGAQSEAGAAVRSQCHPGWVGAERPRDVYDRVAVAYEQRFLDELGDKPRDRELLDDLASAVADPVVEVGCGPGQVGAYMRRRGRRVIGLDVSPRMAALAAQRLDGALVADMRSFPLADAAAGALIAFYSLIHVPRPDLPRVFQEFARVLGPGGRLLVAVHEGEGDVTVSELLNHAVSLSATFFVLEELVTAATANGLDVIAAERREPYPCEGQTVRLYLEAERRP